MEVVCKFVYFEVIVFNLHFNLNRSNRPEVFCEKGVLRNFAKFTGKQNHSLIDFAYKKD